MKYRTPDYIPETREDYVREIKRLKAATETLERRKDYIVITILSINIIIALYTIIDVLTTAKPENVQNEILIAIIICLMSLFAKWYLRNSCQIKQRKLRSDFRNSFCCLYWTEKIREENCFNIEIKRKKEGIDPEEDYYYGNLARRHKAKAEVILHEYILSTNK